VTVRDVLRRSAEYLERKGVESPRLDAELLVAKALGVTRLDLYLEHDRALTEEEQGAARDLVRRRGAREPLAYVLGEWGFRRLTLHCDRRALVPRPETEIVVERCLALLEPLEAPDVLDVGTGTGAIALAVAQEHPAARVTGLDRSPEALALAGENARAAGLELRLLRGDLVEGLPDSPYDLVVSNPPYVRPDEIESLAPEVRDWEPREAILDAGQTAAVIAAARDVLRPGGWLVLEMHGDGAGDVAGALAESGYGPAVVTRDLAGRARVVEARWKA
jgi:release factor glutamine methyltransferase